jgi:response regulator RpfG family c-di-GMP phosphodiesterase
MIFEAHGADVITGRGTRESFHTLLQEPVDLILIDGTNVGIRHAEFICETAKQIQPSIPVALLVLPHTEVPENTLADRVIVRDNAAHIVSEVFDLLQRREVSI